MTMQTPVSGLLKIIGLDGHHGAFQPMRAFVVGLLPGAPHMNLSEIELHKNINVGNTLDFFMSISLILKLFLTAVWMKVKLLVKSVDAKLSYWRSLSLKYPLNSKHIIDTNRPSSQREGGFCTRRVGKKQTNVS